MPIDPATATIAASAINFGASTASGIGARRRQREQNQANRDLAAEQAQWNLQNWNRQNAYNSPTAQMERYREAGLNPHLIYGTGSASAGNADAVKPYDRAEAIGETQISENLGQFQGIYQNSVRTDNIKANTEVQQQDVTNKSLQALGITFDNRAKAVKAGVGEETAEYQVQAAELAVSEAMARNRGIHLNNEQKEAMNPLLQAEMRKRIIKVMAETSSIEKQDALRELQVKYSKLGMLDTFLDMIKEYEITNPAYPFKNPFKR